MKFIQFGLLFFSFILLSGCSSRGMMTAGHNGKMYWNPGECSQYRYYHSEPDTLLCLKDGQETGVKLRPADQQQVNNYYRQEEADQRAWNSINQSIQETNRNIQMQQQNFQLQQLNNNLMYKRYGY